MNISFFITWRNTSSSSRKLDSEEEEDGEEEKEEGEDSDGSIDTPSFPASRQNDYQIVLYTHSHSSQMKMSLHSCSEESMECEVY